MVEYALVLANVAGTTFGTLSMDLQNWVSRLDVDWPLVGYAALALMAFSIARWAFKPRD
jgi:hypothetical protein